MHTEFDQGDGWCMGCMIKGVLFAGEWKVIGFVGSGGVFREGGWCKSDGRILEEEGKEEEGRWDDWGEREG